MFFPYCDRPSYKPIENSNLSYSSLYFTGVLISPYPDLLSDIFCLMVRIIRLMLVLLYI